MRVQLLIEMDERGDVTVKGPLEQKPICYGMLEIARDIIKDLHDKATAQNGAIQIVKPTDAHDRSRDGHISFDQPLGKM